MTGLAFEQLSPGAVVRGPLLPELEMTAEAQSDYERLKKLLDRLGKAVIISAEGETSEIIRRRVFDATATLEVRGIDRRGLGPTHRRAPAFLTRGGGIGEGRLAAPLGIPIRTFRRIPKVDLLRLVPRPSRRGGSSSSQARRT